MVHRRYHRFPYRTFFRWLFFIVLLLDIPGAPLVWAAYWGGYYQQNVDALNSSASYRDSPGAAQAATWRIAEQWPWVFVAALVLFLLYLPIWWWARPARDPKHGYD